MHLKATKIIFVLFFSLVNGFLSEVRSEEYSDIQRMLLRIDDFQQRTFGASEDLRIKELNDEIPDAGKKFDPFEKFYRSIIPTLSDSEKRALLTRTVLFKSRSLNEKISIKNILNEGSWDDLKILTGPTSALDYHLLSRLYQGKSLLGETLTSLMLVTPTDDTDVLISRQRIIKEILNNPKAASDLEEALDDFSEHEINALSLWSSKDPIYEEAYKNQSDALLYWNLPFLKFLNHTNGGLLLGGGLSKLIAGTPKIFMAAGAVFGALSLAGNNSQLFGPSLFIFLEGFMLEHIAPIEKVAKSQYRNLKSRMRGISKLLNTSEELYYSIKNSPELYEALRPNIRNLEKLVVDSNNDREIKIMQRLAKHSDFKKDNFYLDAWYPSLRMFKIFEKKRSQLTEVLADIGFIDAFVSLGKNYKNHFNEKNHYVFANYISEAETPKIEASGFWNPMLASSKAVDNTLTMGRKSQGPQGMIVTGPNAGGKSTYITGIMTNVLLAQTFGIAAADSFEFTPFSRLSTYIHPSDDIAAGNSLYMAEVIRARSHIEDLRNLEDDEFSFAIMDEIFSGTNPQEGAAAAYSIAEYIGGYSNSLNIVATHFPILTKLSCKFSEKDVFGNFKVFVERDENERIKYSFKVIPGISNQTIAIDILEEQGFDTEVLQRAKEILANPSEYYD
ncbi:MAG: hypothetical protein AB8G05_23200 [Oligoflexales bacterium]